MKLQQLLNCQWSIKSMNHVSSYCSEYQTVCQWHGADIQLTQTVQNLLCQFTLTCEFESFCCWEAEKLIWLSFFVLLNFKHCLSTWDVKLCKLLLCIQHYDKKCICELWCYWLQTCAVLRTSYFSFEWFVFNIILITAGVRVSVLFNIACMMNLNPSQFPFQLVWCLYDVCSPVSELKIF